MTENKNKKIMFSIIGIAILLIGVVGVTYSFFNYTRTGSPNTFNTGRIYFNSTQNGTLNITNVFPVKASEVNANTLDSVTVTIIGDTTYNDGEEFEISLVDVENTINGKKIPINYIATYTANTGGSIGNSSSDYWNARESKDASIYLLNETGTVEDGKDVLAGYINNGSTGINGTLTIKAYIDADRIAISDTYDGSELDNNGTTNDWVDDRTVLTTEEWNSLQGNNSISFKIRAESNEGIWIGTIDSCPGCKFIYTKDWMYTTWNSESETPTVLTSGLSDSYLDVVARSGKNYFFGVKLNSNSEITSAYVCGVKENVPFCLEGTSDGSKYTANQTLLQGVSLWNNTCTVGNDYTKCESLNDSSVSAYAHSDGFVSTSISDDYYCVVFSDGEIFCDGNDGG